MEGARCRPAGARRRRRAVRPCTTGLSCRSRLGRSLADSHRRCFVRVRRRLSFCDFQAADVTTLVPPWCAVWLIKAVGCAIERSAHHLPSTRTRSCSLWSALGGQVIGSVASADSVEVRLWSIGGVDLHPRQPVGAPSQCDTVTVRSADRGLDHPLRVSGELRESVIDLHPVQRSAGTQVERCAVDVEQRGGQQCVGVDVERLACRQGQGPIVDVSGSGDEAKMSRRSVGCVPDADVGGVELRVKPSEFSS